MSSTDNSPAATTSRRTDSLSQMARTVLPVAIFLLPLTSNTVAESRYGALTVLLATTLLFIVVAAISVTVVNRSLPTTPAIAAAWVLPPVMCLAWLTSPSGTGAILTFFSIGALGIALTIGDLGETDLPTKVAVPLLAASSLQAMLVVAQTLTDRAIGLTWMDPGAELHFIDGLLRPQGTMHHVY